MKLIIDIDALKKWDPPLIHKLEVFIMTHKLHNLVLDEKKVLEIADAPKENLQWGF